MSPQPRPQRGQIWYVQHPTDPPEKGRRPVLIVSADSRNLNKNALTVLVVPFTTTLGDHPLHMRFQPGETGLPTTSELQPEMITAVLKTSLIQAQGTRTFYNVVLRAVATRVVLAMDVQPKDLPQAL